MTSSRRAPDILSAAKDLLMTRGVRLILYVVVVGILFPSARLILLLAVLIPLAVFAYSEQRKSGKPYLYYLLGFLVFLVVGYAAAVMDVQRVNELRFTTSAIGDGISRVMDGTYTGVGQGFRGPIHVEVRVQNHRIVGIKTLDYPDLISVLDTR